MGNRFQKYILWSGTPIFRIWLKIPFWSTDRWICIAAAHTGKKDAKQIDLYWFSTTTFFRFFVSNTISRSWRILELKENHFKRSWIIRSTQISDPYPTFPFHTDRFLREWNLQLQRQPLFVDSHNQVEAAGFIVATVIERNGVPTTKRHEAVPSSPACESRERK